MLLNLNWKRGSRMDKYRKSAEEIMRRGDAIIAEKKRRSAIYKRTAFAVSGLCAAIIAGVGIWNNPQLKNLTNRTPPTGQYIADTTETTVYSENKSDTTTTAEEKAVVTADTTAAEVTTRPTAVVTDKQTEKSADTKTSPVSANSGGTRTAAPTSAVTAVNTTVVTAEIRPQTTIPYITSAFSECVTTAKPVNTTSFIESPTTPDLPVVTKPVTTTLPPPSGGDIESPATPEIPESIRIADVDFLVNPNNLDDITEITYNNVIYKNTYVTDIYDTIPYNKYEYLGWVYRNQKTYGDLFVIFNHIDNKHNMLIFKPKGSSEYFHFVPEEIL